MANLQYKTRGNSSPQGKPRVYFCCHPEDFEKYFTSVSEEILSKQNCAVWYNGDPEANWDELFFTDLKQMQLFVMPVTTKLLCTGNRALDVEFAFAVENHIPVLPLMQERGLEELFNQKCGDLQFLEKNTHDTSAISYDEKLEKYLSAVLIGDELAEKIRAAFDAYVFLSYRKKDRKYAQELMRLIHRNDFCRDIAIWYDEFLIPGENFNDSIKEALQKSGLFVLTVTPNLVNEINYIMTTEYPMAKEAGKPILPAELVQTDGAQLAEKYADFPGCTDAHNEQELSDALLDAIKKIALKENDTSPEHNFFIGLAYLGGVDVEVDHQRALTLITSAADAGLVEAMDKLVDMYTMGLGVKCSFETALEWNWKIATRLKEEYLRNPNENNLHEMVRVLCSIGSTYEEQGKLRKAKDQYIQALRAIEEFSGKDACSQIRDDLFGCYINLGDICKAEWDLSGAKIYYGNAHDLCQALADESDTVAAQRNLFISYSRLAEIYISENDSVRAKDYLNKCINIGEALVSKTSTEKARHYLWVIYNRLGDICFAEKDLAGAKKYFSEALRISEDLDREKRTISARHDLLLICNKVGLIYKYEGKLEEARKYFGRDLEISELFVKEIGTVEMQRNLSVKYINLGDICKAEGDFSGAKQYYEKSVQIDETLAGETDMLEALRDLSISYNRLGNICKAEGDFSGAKQYYEKSVQVDETLADRTGTEEALRDLSRSYSRLINIFKAEGDFSGAKQYYEKSVQVDETLADIIGTEEALRDLSISYNRLGDICQLKGDLSEAKVYFSKALQIRLDLVDKIGTEEAQHDLAQCYNKLGETCKAEGDLIGAKDNYQKAIRISEDIVNKTEDLEYSEFLAYMYYFYAVLLEKRKLLLFQNKERIQYLQKAASIFEKLCKIRPNVARYKDTLFTIELIMNTK